MIALTQTNPAVAHIAACQIHTLASGAGEAINAPWRYSALAQLRNLQDAGQDLYGLGDLRISEETSAHARQLLAQIGISDLPVPDVAPISGGGVSSSWAVGNREVQLMIFPDGDVLFQKVEDVTILDGPEGEPDKSRYIADFSWLLRKNV